VLPSLEVVIWVAVGGRGTLIGAVLGAVAVNYGRSVLTNYFPEAWPFILGGLFVVVVTLFPDGLVGILRKLFAKHDATSAPGPTEAGPTAPRPGGAVT
jgi:urea transport system permease protein